MGGRDREREGGDIERGETERGWGRYRERGGDIEREGERQRERETETERGAGETERQRARDRGSRDESR